MKTIIITILILSSTLSAFTKFQIENIKIAKKIGSQTYAKDGMNFGDALAGMIVRESSAGLKVVGDKYKNGKLKSLYQSSLGAFQIKLSTAKLTIKKNPRLYKKYNYLVYDGKSIYSKYEKLKKEYQFYKKRLSQNINEIVDEEIKKTYDFKKIQYYNSVLNNKKWIERYKKKEKKAIDTFEWAKKMKIYHEKELKKKKTIIKKEVENEYNTYENKIKEIEKEVKVISHKIAKDTTLINKLLTDVKFSAEIAANYLKMIYNEALNRGFYNVYKRAIGRYNGGWNNKIYYNKVKKNIIDLKRKGII